MTTIRKGGTYRYPYGMSRETWLHLIESDDLEGVVQLLKCHTKIELAIRCREYIKRNQRGKEK
jgi:hypothetical protein